MMADDSGKITGPIVVREYWIYCAECNNEDLEQQIGLVKPEAVKHFRSIGWRIRKGLWICPACLGTDPDYEGGKL